MADLGAIHNVGESIALLLQRRRALLAEEGRLAPVPDSEDIQHYPLSKISGSAPPTSGLSICCYHVGYSDHSLARSPARDASVGHGISLELRYMVASWSRNAIDELAHISWAMLELNRYPVLDRSMLINPASWSREESLQIVPEEASSDELFRLWEALKQKYRLSALFRVRVVRIGYGPTTDSLPVVASRFSFGHGDVSQEQAIA